MARRIFSLGLILVLALLVIAAGAALLASAPGHARSAGSWWPGLRAPWTAACASARCAATPGGVSSCGTSSWLRRRDGR